MGAEAGAQSYGEMVLADVPVAFWRLGQEGRDPLANAGTGGSALAGKVVGQVVLAQPGPQPPAYPLLEAGNRGVLFSGQRGYVRVLDPGLHSPLDFDLGDTITLEAWVNPSSLSGGQNMYIVGKGRTNNRGVARENQNYALRLQGGEGSARVSFLFRNRRNRPGTQEDFHRWTSSAGFVLDGYWHHVAVSYTFGQPDSIRGYVDGQPVPGRWDLGGATAEPPVVDDDELWIGSSLGGSAGNTFAGLLDEVAIHRKALDRETIQRRYRFTAPPAAGLVEQLAELPDDAILVEIFENIPDRNWPPALGASSYSYRVPAYGLMGIPTRYSDRGQISDWSNPLLLRARSKRQLTGGEYRFLLRAKNAARLFIDGRLVAQTEFMNRNASGHEPVPDLTASPYAVAAPLASGHQEVVSQIVLEEGEHLMRVETVVGGKGLRAELGELCVAIARGDQSFELLFGPQPESKVELTEDGWLDYVRQATRQLDELNRRNREAASAQVASYWNRRHEVARTEIGGQAVAPLPDLPDGMPAFNDVDHFIGAALSEARLQPARLTSDFEFLRRVTLDTVGVIPTREEIASFLADQRSDRRARVIDRLLADDRWADHWVGYWQDVLAENPGILKPTLNNTGPFRWWIYESFLDNKPFDQFAAELVMMEGNPYGGAPGGFAMATQNDVPMAAKAHVLTKAFLGLEMKCARCHDAPFHSFTQRDLFNVAALLETRPITLPKTSTVPTSPGGREPLVTISLKAGESIEPAWPFPDVAPGELPADLLERPQNPRSRLAAIVTSPRNMRFAQVVVNRLWQRYLGRGIVEPVDDWEDTESSHPQLLDYLARELMLNDYDLKHVARLILNSHTYQRRVDGELVKESPDSIRLFATPSRRRMTAEQLVDSLFFACGKQLGSEELTLDPEGRRPVDTFLNLGVPRRAWQFTSLSNERDRPALALPVAQSIVDTLATFGWRESRPHPITVRDETPTMLQPLTLANGIASTRIARLSDDSSLTRLCLEEVPPAQLVENFFLQLLSRPPSSTERELFEQVLDEGYGDRRVDAPIVRNHLLRLRTAVSWSNHLSAEATRVKLQLERMAQQGDPPTARLQSDWRERAEDVVWTLVNSPEFLFLP